MATLFEALRFGPTLEFNGVGGGYQGEEKTVIPSEAFAKISCRLVPNQKGRDIAELVMKAIRDRCPPSVTVEVSDPEMGDPYLVVPPGHENTPSTNHPSLLGLSLMLKKRSKPRLERNQSTYEKVAAFRLFLTLRGRWFGLPTDWTFSRQRTICTLLMRVFT